MRKAMITGMALSLLSVCSGARATPNVTAIAAGGSHGLALLSDGTVWAWGSNSGGQLGDGTTTDRSVPIQVAGVTGAVAVAAGADHSLALKNDGSVWAWGNCGDGTPSIALTPVKMSGLSGVVSIKVLDSYSLALNEDGTVWAWDSNAMAPRTPAQISGLSGVVAISGGGLFRGVALKGDGTVWAWGPNTFGEVGDGKTTNRWVPLQVGGLTGVSAIAADYYSSLVIRADGTVWEWGYGVTAPVQVSGLDNVVAVVAAWPHNLAVKADGTVWEWNWSCGPFPPAQVSGLTGIKEVSVSGASGLALGASGLALKDDGSIWTWGSNDHGRLGDKTPIWRSSPVQVNGLGGATVIAAGGGSSLAVNGDGTVWSWGELTDGTSGSNPAQLGLNGIVALAQGLSSYLALNGDGTVWFGGLGRLGACVPADARAGHRTQRGASDRGWLSQYGREGGRECLGVGRQRGRRVGRRDHSKPCHTCAGERHRRGHGGRRGVRC